jgi:hypothetical protein
MKGLHWTLILAIIIFAVLLVLMFTVFIGPLPAQGSSFFNQEEFRRYCAWWAQTDYKDTFATVKNEPDKDMSGLCTQALNLQCPPTCLDSSNPNDPNWDRCRAMCKVSYPKV